MIDPRERELFDRAKNLHREIAALQEDLAALKKEAVDDLGLSKERVGDLLAVAKLDVMDQVKRARKDEQRKRRDDLAGQLSMLDDAPKRRSALRQTIAVEVAPEPPHDPDTGEVIEEGEATPAKQEDRPPTPEEIAELASEAGPNARTVTAGPVTLTWTHQDDDLEIPTFARRGHPDCAYGRAPEAAE